MLLDQELPQAINRAARRTKQNRSALVRTAIREHLRGLSIKALEERDRKGYTNPKHSAEECLDWEAEATLATE